MNNHRSTALTIPLIAVMLLMSLAVVTMLCGKALRTEGQAVELTKAVIRAGSAAELFYGCSSAEELAEMLNGQVQSDIVTAEYEDNMTVHVELIDEGTMLRGEISIVGRDGEIYSLSCLKAENVGVR